MSKLRFHYKSNWKWIGDVVVFGFCIFVENKNWFLKKYMWSKKLLKWGKKLVRHCQSPWILMSASSSWFYMEIHQIVDLLRRCEKFFTLIQKFFTPFMGVKTFERLTIMKENIFIRVMIMKVSPWICRRVFFDSYIWKYELWWDWKILECWLENDVPRF